MVRELSFLKLEMVDHTASCDWILDDVYMLPFQIASNQDICEMPYTLGQDSSGVQTYEAMYQIQQTLLSQAGELRIRCHPYEETNWITRGCSAKQGNWIAEPPKPNGSALNVSYYYGMNLAVVMLMAITNLSFWF